MKLTQEQSLYATGHTDGYLQAVADANLESKPETLEQYFDRRDTPSRNSPVGNTMVRILAKFPEISFTEARTKAHELLAIAAKSRVYRGPVVLSAEELAGRKERLARVFRGPKSTGGLAKTVIPGVSGYSVDTQSGASRGIPLPTHDEGLETSL
jgi:hypothetical protein